MCLQMGYLLAGLLLERMQHNAKKRKNSPHSFELDEGCLLGSAQCSLAAHVSDTRRHGASLRLAQNISRVRKVGGVVRDGALNPRAAGIAQLHAISKPIVVAVQAAVGAGPALLSDTRECGPELVARASPVGVDVPAEEKEGGRGIVSE